MHALIVGALGQVRTHSWDLAKLLYEWSQRHGWRWATYESEGEWLGDPAIALGRTTYYSLIEGWRTLVVERQVPEAKVQTLETSKVGIVLKAIRSGEVGTAQALSDAETLSKSDLIIKYRPEKSDRSDNDADVPAQATEPPPGATEAPDEGNPTSEQSAAVEAPEHALLEWHAWCEEQGLIDIDGTTEDGEAVWQVLDQNR